MRGAGIADELLMRELESDRRTPEAHALALALMTPDHKYLTGYSVGEVLAVAIRAAATGSRSYARAAK